MSHYTLDTASRHKALRMFTLRVIDDRRPDSTTRLVVLQAVIAAYPGTTAHEMDREIDYLITAGLATRSYCGADTLLQLTKTGIDLVESEEDAWFPNDSEANTGADMTHGVTAQIKMIMGALNLKQTDLAEAFGVSLSRIKALTSGRVKRLDRNEYAALVKKFNISANWLATGVGEMFFTQEELNAYTNPDGTNADAEGTGLTREVVLAFEGTLTMGHQRNDTHITLTQTEEDLIRAYRRACHFKSEHSTAEDPDEIATLAMVETISYLVDGLSIGSIQYVMTEASRILAAATPFSRDSAWFQSDIEALHHMTDIQHKEQPE